MFDFLKKKQNEESCSVSAIVVAAGKSTRMRGENKQFAEIFGKPVLAYSLEALECCSSIDEIVIVTRENDILLVNDIVRNFGITKAVSIIPGGETRQQSVKLGLDAAIDCGIVVIHDGARPCTRPEHIELTVSAAAEFGAAALGCPVTDTLKIVGDHSVIKGTLDREGIWQIQTPQVFKRDIIAKAHQKAIETGITATDDCALVENMGISVHIVEGVRSNIKITTQEDIYLARGIIEGREDEQV